MHPGRRRSHCGTRSCKNWRARAATAGQASSLGRPNPRPYRFSVPANWKENGNTDESHRAEKDSRCSRLDTQLHVEAVVLIQLSFERAEVVREQIEAYALVSKGQQHSANRRLDPDHERDGARRSEAEQVDA